MKEQIEKIIKDYASANICKKCKGGGYDYDEHLPCVICNETGLTDWDFGLAAEKIEELYGKR